jgi:signal transduction histidine kinase
VIKRAFLNNESEIYSTDKVVINKSRDSSTGYNFIYLTSVLDNGYKLYMRVAITAIKESVKISNRFLQIMGILTIIISGIMVKIISRRFTDPILQLNKIADQMSKLDFNVKYISSNSNDEIDHLGKSINQMSDTMEKTIKQLRNTNIELEKDIEKKSKTDEMRKQFISDVSHELKTPIALIQGYAEGLVENVANDDESRKFYAEVILDETNKMDILVKRLLELIKIEYGEMEFVNSEFDITELISEIIRKHHVVLNEKNIEIKYDKNKKIFVVADEFYIEQIVNNYFTNAIKNVKEVNGRKEIKIDVTKMEDTVRVSVYNSGSKIKEEDLNRIWRRFFKSDESRNRDDGGTGIGLSIVKALMKQMNRNYGVTNTEEGVEFFFEI